MSRSRPDLRTLQPRRVCLIKPSSLGDVVQALPVLAALREHWPDAHIAWVINLSLRGLLDGNPLLDEVIGFDRSGVNQGLAGAALLGQFLKDLRRQWFDVAIDLQGLLRSGVMALATGAPVRVGRASAREGATFAYTHSIPRRVGHPHAVDEMLAVAEAFGADVNHPRFVLTVPETARTWAQEVLAAVRSPRVVLNIGARWPTKRWPPERYAEVARHAVDAFGAGLVAVGATEDQPLVASLREQLGPLPLLDLSGQTSLPQLAAVAAQCDLFLSNDTGPLHLAAATGTKVVGIYTCTRPEWNGPYGANAVTVSTHVDCAGSYLGRCDRLDCMHELAAERVWRAVASELAKARWARGPAA